MQVWRQGSPRQGASCCCPGSCCGGCRNRCLGCEERCWDTRPGHTPWMEYIDGWHGAMHVGDIRRACAVHVRAVEGSCPMEVGGMKGSSVAGGSMIRGGCTVYRAAVNRTAVVGEALDSG